MEKNVFEKGMAYAEYRQMTERLISEGKTTGKKQSEALHQYTVLNQKRMDRLDKTVSLDDRLAGLLHSAPAMKWLLITEAWCGDAAQNVPVIVKIAEVSDDIELKLILRDENPEIMNRYLTEGTRSIPILIAFDKDMKELWTWGPRPEPAQKLRQAFKNNPEESKEEFITKVQKWYARDKNRTIQKEIAERIKQMK